MRQVFILAGVYIIVALSWTLYAPLTSYALIKTFAKDGSDKSACEQALLQAGAGATPALLHGLKSPSSQVRLHCARILALRGYPEGDRELLQLLREYGQDINDPRGAMAESFLLSVWEERAAPGEALRQRLMRTENTTGQSSAKLILLDEALARRPTWAAGYVQRARVYWQNGELRRAQHDALTALLFEPDEFEAMVTLGSIFMSLKAPPQAYACFTQAVRVNPRLKYELREEIQEILKILEIEKAGRRLEHRKDTPLA